MILYYFFPVFIFFEKSQPTVACVPKQNVTTSATPPPVICKTVKNKTCHFPFIDDNIMYQQCAPHKSQFWCAVSVNADNSYKDWDYCDPKTCPQPEVPCSDCDECPANTKQQRAPPTANTDYFAEYLGSVIIKMFQSMGAPTFEQVPRNYMVNTAVPFWGNIPNTYGVYLFFMGTNSLTNMRTAWNNINNKFALTIRQQKSRFIKPWYVGKGHNLRERFGDHNSDDTGAMTKWRRMLGYTVRPTLAAGAEAIANNYGFTDLYYTYIPLRDEFDTVLIEMIFLSLFNFPNNCADNYPRRNTADNPPNLNAGVSTVNLYELTKDTLNQKVLYNMNRYFPFLYRTPLGNPNPIPEVQFSQDSNFY